MSTDQTPETTEAQLEETQATDNKSEVSEFQTALIRERTIAGAMKVQTGKAKDMYDELSPEDKAKVDKAVGVQGIHEIKQVFTDHLIAKQRKVKE